MTLTLSASGAHPVQPTRASATVWALVDLSLLCAVVAVSADMLIQMRALQSPIWLYCYATTLLRIAMNWPVMLPVILRNRVLFLYPAICVASVLWSLTKGYSLAASLQLSMTMLIGLYLGWRYSMAVLIKTLAVILTLGVVLSLLHWATGLFPWPVHTRIGGLAGLFSSKNMLGLRALFAVIAVLAILLMRRSEAGSLIRIMALFAAFACILAIALSLSMTSVLLLPAMTGLLLLLCTDRLPRAVSLMGMSLGVLSLALGPLALALWGLNPVDLVLGSVGKSSTLTGRTVLWDIAWTVHLDYPLLGTGYRSFWRAPTFLGERLQIEAAGAVTSASFHNFLLEILVSAGWLAVAAMIAVLWLAVARMIRVYRLTRSVAYAAALTLMFGILVSSLLGTTLYRGHDIMIVLVVAFAVTAGEDLRALAARAATRD